MSASDNAIVHRRMLDALLRGDVATLNDLFAENVVWHLPGNSMVAGNHNGRAAVLDFLGRVMELTDGTFRLDLIDSAACDSGVFAWQRVTAQRQDKKLEENEIIFFRMRDGRVVEVWHRPEQPALDEFFS